MSRPDPKMIIDLLFASKGFSKSAQLARFSDSHFSLFIEIKPFWGNFPTFSSSGNLVLCLRSARRCWANSPTTSLASARSNRWSSCRSAWRRAARWRAPRRRWSSSTPSTAWSSQSSCLKTKRSSWGILVADVTCGSMWSQPGLLRTSSQAWKWRHQFTKSEKS